MDRVVKFGKYFFFNKVTLTLFDIGFSGAFNRGEGLDVHHNLLTMIMKFGSCKT